MRKKLVSNRIAAGPDRVLSALHVYDGLTEQARFAVLELTWKDNAKKVSCIPAGHYVIMPEHHEKFGDCFRITSEIPGRSGVLLHIGNFPKNTEGCLLIGMGFSDLDADGLFEANRSTQAMSYLFQLVSGEADLYIFDATGGHNG